MVEKPYSSSEFIFAASGIERCYVLDKLGVLDPVRMYPKMPDPSGDDPSLMVEMAVDAAL